MASRLDRYSVSEHAWGGRREQVKHGELQVLRLPDGSVKAVDFLCPCGCGMGGYTPVTQGTPKTERHWQYMENGHLVWPSVRYMGGCKSHFFIKADGTVDWCPDSGQI